VGCIEEGSDGDSGVAAYPEIRHDPATRQGLRWKAGGHRHLFVAPQGRVQLQQGFVSRTPQRQVSALERLTRTISNSHSVIRFWRASPLGARSFVS
jgi:hypothetical protein